MITGDLLPSSAMIKELSQEFGMPMSQGDLTEQKLLAVAPAPSLEDLRSRKSTLASQIHSHQEKYLRWRSNVILKSRDQKASLVQVGAPPLAASLPGPGPRGRLRGTASLWLDSPAQGPQARQCSVKGTAMPGCTFPPSFWPWQSSSFLKGGKKHSKLFSFGS